jgi:deoxycytidylate deaminase
MSFRPVTISNKWAKILGEVQDVSNNSNMGTRLGSALLEKGRVIKTGYNHADRCQWHGITMPCIHAEMSVTHSISPYNRPQNYRRLWGCGDPKNRIYTEEEVKFTGKRVYGENRCFEEAL